MRDSWTGYLLPVRDGPGALPDGQSCWDAAAVVAVSCQNVTLISFSFRAWMGLIWEISARAARQNAWNFGARLFCKNIKKSGFNDIYNIQFFQDTYSQNGFFRKCFSHPTRPPAGPYCPYNILGQFWIILTGCPYKIILLWVILTGYPVFPGSKPNQTDLCSNIGARYPEIGSLTVQNILILSFAAKSGAPDHPIRSVSLS